VPYIRITGPGNVIARRGQSHHASGRGARAPYRDCLGDVVASAFYNVFDERSAPIGLDLGVKIKFATADDSKGLGTGKNDYAGQADLFQRRTAHSLPSARSVTGGTAIPRDRICATCPTRRSAPRTACRNRRASASSTTGAIESCREAPA